jgi:peptidylprolyl isomerase
VIPAHLAYGERAIGKIPPNSTLTFVIDLIEVRTRD